MNQLNRPYLDQAKEAAFLERDLAQRALSDLDLELVWLRLKQVLIRSMNCSAVIFSTRWRKPEGKSAGQVELQNS